MGFKPGDKNINRKGRPKGSRNKVSVDKEVKDALAKGLTLDEWGRKLLEMMKEIPVESPQHTKIVTLYQNHLQFLATSALKIDKVDGRLKDEDTPSKKAVPQSGNTAPQVVKFKKTAD